VTLRGVAAAAGLALSFALHAAEPDYSFDASEFEKKPFVLGGYLVLNAERFELNRGGAFYELSEAGRDGRGRLERATATLKLTGKARAGDWLVTTRTNSEATHDQIASDSSSRFDELLVSWKPSPSFTLDAGKTVVKWGKGYAWNPVGFIERPKDPNDPELAREGFTVLATDIVRTFQGEGLQTVAFTPLLVPVTGGLNDDFGRPDHLNFAARLYLLYRDTDIDFYFLRAGSRSRRFGVDFSRNLGSNIEVHGEWARIEAQDFATVDAMRAVSRRTEAVQSWLLGLRYLSERDTTYIAELYRNGAGFSTGEFRAFTDFVDSATLARTPALLSRVQSLAPMYARQTPLRNYFYLRISQKEPFDILYWTPSVTTIVNLSDKSFSIAPELLYTGRDNLELRARAIFLEGGKGTDYGERLSERRIELLARIYF
jgi:hypothetical protein